MPKGEPNKRYPVEFKQHVTNVTEISLFGQKLYLSPSLNLCSRDIVSYALSDKPIKMLDKAFAQIPDSTYLILHSDQGWQYQHKAIPTDIEG